MYIYINGDIKEASAARLSVFEHGFMYGLGLFETFRLYNGHPFLIDDHFRRLEEGLRVMNITWEYQRDQVVEKLRSLVEANQWKNAYVRYNIAAGGGGIGLSTEPYSRPTEIIYMKPLDAPDRTKLPVKDAHILGTRRNTPEANVRLKSHHFLNNVIAKQERSGNSNSEGIFLTEEGYVAEGIVSNVFWVKNGTLYTPSLNTGILSGITRAFVLQLAKRNSMYVREGRFRLQHLLHADEAFVTNSIQEIVRLSSVEERTFADVSGSITRTLQQEYAKYCGHGWSMKEIFNY